jgi:ubiquinol-cytochrome c reductase iron-sulfur subunit
VLRFARGCGARIQENRAAATNTRLADVGPHALQRTQAVSSFAKDQLGKRWVTHMSVASGVIETGETSRRDFLYVTTGAVATIGAAIAIWPLIDNINPDAAGCSVAAVEMDLRPIALGQRVTARWRDGPVFIEHRTPEAIALARADDNRAEPIDPATDARRVKNPEWLFVVGVCTHLGCIPRGQRQDEPRSEYGGWFCPCHGSKYDTSGRVRRGPAPRNLEVPVYEFIRPDFIRIG